MTSRLLVVAVALAPVMSVLVLGRRGRRVAGRPSRRAPTTGRPTAAGRKADAYSTLDQITRANVGRLAGRVAVRPARAGGDRGRFQVNPIVVDGVIFTTTPGGSLDRARRGDRDVEVVVEFRHHAAQRTRRHLLDRRQGDTHPRRLRALRLRDRRRDRNGHHARSGATAASICIRISDAIPERQSVSLTTPGVIYKDLYIVGGRTSEGLPASPGRHPRLRRPHRAAALVVPHDSASRRVRLRHVAEGRVDLQRLREQLGRHGGRRRARHRLRADRLGGRRLLRREPASATISSRTRCSRSTPRPASGSGTSRRCSHDIWDRDFPSPPTLVTVRRNGQTVDAVAQTTKHGVAVPVRSRDRHAAVSDRVAQGAAEHGRR